MVRVTFWMSLLLVLLIVRQANTIAEQSSELEKEQSCLERDLMRITELKQKKELRSGHCHVSGYY
jgi:Tfp pilus assembly protein PilN